MHTPRSLKMGSVVVRGINYGDVKNWQHEQLQDLVGSIFLSAEPSNKYDSSAIKVMGKVIRSKRVTTVHIGYLPHEVLDRAHREKWCELNWEAEEIGRFRPRYGSNTLCRAFCKISDRQTFIFHHMTSDEADGPAVKVRMQTDESMYDGHTYVCIHYDSQNSGLGWRDVVLLKKTEDGFFACDGSSDIWGRPVAQKYFKFAQLKAAKVDEVSEKGSPAKRAKTE